DMLYIPVEKTENVSTDSDSINTAAVQVIREKQLYAIRLDNGKYKAVVNLKNKQIIGSMGRELVVNAYHYKTDPEKLLDQGDFAGYEAVTQHADITYERISVDTEAQKLARRMRSCWGYLLMTACIIRMISAV
ncbi:MAG: hypothetical protein ACLT16_19870, partial [[Clostridium] innocuum]